MANRDWNMFWDPVFSLFGMRILVWRSAGSQDRVRILCGIKGQQDESIVQNGHVRRRDSDMASINGTPT